jgi:hypothetical protein
MGVEARKERSVQKLLLLLLVVQEEEGVAWTPMIINLEYSYRSILRG